MGEGFVAWWLDVKSRLFCIAQETSVIVIDEDFNAFFNEYLNDKTSGEGKLFTYMATS